MSAQSQFLDVIDRDEAERRFHVALDLRTLATQIVPLNGALGRVIADDVHSPVDVPSFDRANVDGYALRAAETFRASTSLMTTRERFAFTNHVREAVTCVEMPALLG